MEQVRLKKIVQSWLDTSYSGVTIKEFLILPTNKLDEETGKWVSDSFTLFINLSRSGVDEEKWIEMSNKRNVESLLESLLGFECCVDFV
jgi:hypothetical protein